MSCVMLAPGVLLANAAQVVYTLTGTTNPAFGPVHAEAFQFSATGFVASYVSLSAVQLDSCTACTQPGTTVEFYPNGTVQTIIPADYIRFTDANGIVYGFYFPPGSFSTAGTYHTFDDPPYITSNIGTLTVQVMQTPPNPVPLPPSVLLALTGSVAIGIYFMSRRVRRGAGS